MKVTAELADKVAKRVKDNRAEPDWEEVLWEELGWLDLDFTQVGILFDMVVIRWDRVKAVAA